MGTISINSDTILIESREWRAQERTSDCLIENVELYLLMLRKMEMNIPMVKNIFLH